jgi:hypothetical protein
MRPIPGKLLLTALAGSLAWGGTARAQSTTVDEGSLMVTRNGASIGRESFRIIQATPGELLTASGQGVYGDRRLAPALSVDLAGNPVLYRFESRTGAAAEERIQGTARGARLSMLRHTPSSEAVREYLVNAPTLLLDDEVYHHYAFLPLKQPGQLSVITPRRNVQRPALVEDMGVETISLDRREIEARRYRVTLSDGVREAWFDARGRLLRVAHPDKGILATRESLPQ